MCNCIIWSPPTPPPFSSSIIRLGNSTLSNSQIPATHFPIIRNNGRLQLIQCTMKPKSGSEAEAEGYGEFKFEDKGSDDLELKRLRTDASLEKIGDKEEFGGESEKGSGESGDEMVKMESRKKRQLMKRSNMVAKQVISIQSAQSLGFVSQLWVDTSSWLVLVVEVRPSLLAGESERFLLQDINKVGDVVLVEDESVMDSDFKMIRLDTLVGYRVVTPGNRNIGKVRGYTFNINSGAVESLELDSFGISIIPSSLVSTYALLVEDVLEVIADTVIVHEAAASRIQRLTKGFWDDQNAGISIDDDTEYVDERPARSNTRRGSRGRKSRSKMRDADDDWELPMDYL